MKVIVTGPTGRAGQEVVKKCLEDERITKVVILTRRGLSGEIESHPKADVIMHQDFTQYSDYLVRRMQGAEACIWAIGARQERAKTDKSVERSVGVDIPVSSAKILCEKLADKTPGGVKFRFVYCSPKHTERSKKTLMFANDTRKLANDLEKGIADVVNANNDKFEAYTLRPANFMMPDSPLPALTPSSKKLVPGLGQSVAASIDPARVGKAMAMIARDGWKEKVVENETILEISC
ncbi:NAD(P)-binding domain protein [Metarhizium album ARSEF 1941]|uniref:NAD(P)-binding domain protein n=1 Tax=Metarhizium album (strain ARSEF 1941) TaxID=1081103 RepID=A0A0B2X136_METAS|nr:NAD(P)-binding domain protein [Metarhizium album ARSEF 1941]KHN99372.1 NAD(P)-binding domain protein [Metarhizium album ARSEF 1941]